MAARQVSDQMDPFPLDTVLWGTALLILTLGLIMVASASIEMSARNYGSSYYLMSRHSVYLVISLTIGILAIGIPVRFWQKMGIPLMLLGILLLVLVVIPGIGREVKGSTRWISLGLFSIQGSEFVKLFVVIYIAGYLARKKGLGNASFFSFLKPLLVISLLVYLLIIQPDFGTAVVIMSAVIGMIFLAGAPVKYFMPLMIGCIAAGGLLVTLQPYRLARVKAFIDPWESQFDGGYQLTQALIAFGRGDLFGVGLGNSIQKLGYLPEAHTDFLYSILAEEFGVIGASLVVILYCVFILRALWIGKNAQNRGKEFHAYLAYGICLMIGIQACINLGVNLGLLPTKGITLPLMSYGGNSLMVSCLMVGLLLRIEFENRIPLRTRRAHGRQSGS